MVSVMGHCQRGAVLCSPCGMCGSGLETARHLWECPAQSQQWQWWLARQGLHTWLSTYMVHRVSRVQSQLWELSSNSGRRL